MDQKDESIAFLFGNEGRDRPQWDAQKRFISDDFRPVYTQGVTAKGHLPEAVFARFLEAARTDQITALETFRIWMATERPQGGCFADVAMDRMDARSPEWDLETGAGIFGLFSEIMDEFYRISSKSEMFFDAWSQSESVINNLRRAPKDKPWLDTIQKSARDGDAVSWMIQIVGRRELWARGISGDRRRDNDDFLMSEDELKRFIRKLFARLKLMKNTQIISLPRLPGVLYTLKETPWESRTFPLFLNRLYGPQVHDPEFLKFLIAVGGTVVSSNKGAYQTLSQETLRILLDEDYVHQRLANIRKRRVGKELSLLRSEVESMIERASHY